MNVFRAPFYSHNGLNDQVYRKWSTGNINENMYCRWPPVNVLPYGSSRGFVPNWFDNYYPVMPNVGYNPAIVVPPPKWISSFDCRKTQSAGIKVHSNSRNELSVFENVESKDKQRTGWVPKNNWYNRTSYEHRNHVENVHPNQPPKHFAKFAAKDLPARQKPPFRNVCTLCRQNGERRELFLDHPLKDREGKVACPILRKYVCPYCSATGDVAHTKSYCPLKPAEPLAIKLKRTTRDSCGRFRK